MKLLAMDRLLPGITFEHIKLHLKDEADHAWKNYENGIFRELYMRGDKPGAVIVLECNGIDDANKILSELPLVKEKLIEFDIIPLEPFVTFKFLFAK
jgi:hypothetical protein